MSTTISIDPIAIVHSPFKEKFGIPRQPGLSKSLTSSVKFLPGYSNEEVIRGLEGCSHIWLLFIFSECVDKGWSTMVRPPRLGGNKRMGVFATRSPFRPNPIGLSPVKLVEIVQNGKELELIVSGADLLDGTPVIDIKPYLPYSDCITDAEFPFANEIRLLQQEVTFSETAAPKVLEAETRLALPVKQQICELLKCDPRPAYKKNAPDRVYGVRLHDMNIRFSINDDQIRVHDIETIC